MTRTDSLVDGLLEVGHGSGGHLITLKAGVWKNPMMLFGHRCSVGARDLYQVLQLHMYNKNDDNERYSSRFSNSVQ